MPSGNRQQHRDGPGLRERVTFTFALGAAVVLLVLAVSVFTISRGFLLDQRERSAGRQAAADAHVVRGRLAGPEAEPADALTAADPPADTVLLLRWEGRWHRSEPDIGAEDLPAELVDSVTAGIPMTIPVTAHGAPYFAVSVPFDAPGTALVELAPVQELQETLRVLGIVLIACSVAATLGAAALGLWASRRALRPLQALAGTAAQIAGGRLDSRLSPTQDRDLTTIVASFNTMVDILQRRIERERQLFGDVSHELRSPLTTLFTSVEVLRRHQDDLPDRSRRAVDLVTKEVTHLRRLLDDLLALARAEAGLDLSESLSVGELLAHALTESGRDPTLLSVAADSMISGRKLALERAFVNLMDNADRHGGGLVAVVLRVADAHVEVLIDDCGPGVPPQDRERIFERFATRPMARGSAAGTGLGLALVRETVTAHGGTVRCVERPGGGARFVVSLPRAEL